MRTGGYVIHVCLCDRSICNAPLKKFDCLSCWGNILFSNILQIYPFGFILSYFYISFRSIKQIFYLFKIDLNHRYFNPKLDVRGLFGNFVKYLWNKPWQDTHFHVIMIIRANTGMSFTWGSLPIGKNSSVETLEGELYHIFPYLLIDLFLSRLLVKNTIESKLMLWLFVFDSNWLTIGSLDDILSVLLFLVEWPYS